MVQASLFDTKQDTLLQQQFNEYDESNPEVYKELIKMARQAKAAGQKKIGIRMMIEVIRWHRMINTTDKNSDYKINNDYSPRYARKIIDEYPEFDGMFELRRITR